MAKKSGTKPVKPKTTPNGTVDAVAAPAIEPKHVSDAGAPAKKVSQALIDTIEKRKAAAAKHGPGKGAFGRPAGRRGRRPKRAVEYTPQNSEDGATEDPFEAENESFERIEYDTGIRFKEAGDDSAFNLEGYDFDEELNFDR
jgi:hypothetical protein